MAYVSKRNLEDDEAVDEDEDEDDDSVSAFDTSSSSSECSSSSDDDDDDDDYGSDDQTSDSAEKKKKANAKKRKLQTVARAEPVRIGHVDVGVLFRALWDVALPVTEAQAEAKFQPIDPKSGMVYVGTHCGRVMCVELWNPNRLVPPADYDSMYGRGTLARIVDAVAEMTSQNQGVAPSATEAVVKNPEEFRTKKA
jgi:hypothetical protein